MRGVKEELAALKRERIVAAAVDLFYERGYENATLEAVADSIGMTKPFIYGQFASKVELLAEICSLGIHDLLKVIDTTLEREKNPTMALQILSESFVVSVLENQKSIAVFAREEKNLLPEDFKRINLLRREYHQKLEGILEAGRKSGEFAIKDSSVAAFMISGAVSWTYIWFRPNGRLSVRKLSREVQSLIMSMVGITLRT